MQNIIISIPAFADICTESQTVWIQDEAPRFVGPHLEQNCLHGFQQSSNFTASRQRVGLGSCILDGF